METLLVIACSIATVLIIAIAVIEVEKRSIKKVLTIKTFGHV